MFGTRSGLMVEMGGSMATYQLLSWNRGARRRTDRDSGDSRKGGSHFPSRSHRIVAFELVLFTCCRLAQPKTIIFFRRTYLTAWTARPTISRFPCPFRYIVHLEIVQPGSCFRMLCWAFEGLEAEQGIRGWSCERCRARE